MVGKTTKPHFFAKREAISVTISESVEIGRWAPCCSIEPTGIIIVGFFDLINF